MSKRWITFFALFALVSTPAVVAQTQADGELRGTLKSKDDTTLTIETVKGQTVSFEITEQSLLPDTLSTGDMVVVHHGLSDTESDMRPVNEVRIADDVELDLTAEQNTDRGQYASLPQTASPLAALLFAGLVAFGGALGLRRRS